MGRQETPADNRRSVGRAGRPPGTVVHRSRASERVDARTGGPAPAAAHQCCCSMHAALTLACGKVMKPTPNMRGAGLVGSRWVWWGAT